ncbi:MAG TPA: radical SAM protein [Candidatus Merdivicinus intestinavium]|nr:radical SAM protein [Candidatus Merdivicinus intestinavium]
MRFKRIYVEISNICNLKCPFCSKSTRPPRSMNEEEFRHVVREIAPFTGNVYFHVKGEPLLHPLLGRFFDICEENDLRVNLTTNGSLLAKNQELLMRKNALRQVNISLHSFPFQNGANGEAPEFYNELDLDGLDTYMQTALGFAARFARERKKFAVLRLWSLGKGRRLDPAARRMTEIIEAAYPEAAPLEEKMLRRPSICLEKGVFLSWEEEFAWPTLKSPYVSDTGICQGTRSMVAVLCDGTVVPCCLDANGEAPLGNLFAESFAEIVSGDYFQRISRNFDNRHVTLPLCRHCTYRLRFDKLAGGAFQEEDGEPGNL